MRLTDVAVEDRITAGNACTFIETVSANPHNGSGNPTLTLRNASEQKTCWYYNLEERMEQERTKRKEETKRKSGIRSRN